MLPLVETLAFLLATRLELLPLGFDEFEEEEKEVVLSLRLGHGGRSGHTMPVTAWKVSTAFSGSLHRRYDICSAKEALGGRGGEGGREKRETKEDDGEGKDSQEREGGAVGGGEGGRGGCGGRDVANTIRDVYSIQNGETKVPHPSQEEYTGLGE